MIRPTLTFARRCAFFAILVCGQPAFSSPYLYVVDQSDKLDAIDIATGTIAWSVPLDDATRTAQVSLSPDGSAIYVSNTQFGHNIGIVDPTVPAFRAYLPNTGGAAHFIFSPDAATLYVQAMDGSIEAIRASDGAVLRTIPLPPSSQFEVICLNQDGSKLFAKDSGASVVRIYDAATFAPLDTVPMPLFGSDDLAVSPDGQSLFVLSGTLGELLQIDVQTKATTADIPIALGGGEGNPVMVVSPDGKNVYLEDIDGEVIVAVDVAARSAVRISVPALPVGLALSGNGSRLYTLLYPGAIAEIDTQSRSVLRVLPTPDVIVARQGFFGAPATQVFVANAGGNDLSVIASATRQAGAPVPVGNSPSAVTTTANGTTVYVANHADNSITMINNPTHAAVATFATGAGPCAAAVSPDGQKLYVVNDGELSMSVLDATTGVASTPISFPVGAVGTGCSVVVAPDGKSIYAIQGGRLFPINAATHQFFGTDTFGFTIAGVAVSADSQAIYTTSDSNDTLAIFDQGKLRSVVFVGPASTSPVHYGPTAVVLSPEGTYAYTANTANNSVSIIDVINSKVVDVVAVGDAPSSLGITPDGHWLYVANSASNTVSVIDTGVNAVVATLSGFNHPTAIGNIVDPPFDRIFRGGFE